MTGKTGKPKLALALALQVGNFEFERVHGLAGLQQIAFRTAWDPTRSHNDTEAARAPIIRLTGLPGRL